MPALIDLHCHSTVSDGLLSPQDLVEYAAGRGVKVLGLTDHDDLGGLAQAREAAKKHQIAFVDGVEISVTWKKRTLHIVGLKINPENEALKQALSKVRVGREERAKEIAYGLEKAGIEAAYEGAKQFSKQSVMTRSHFAQYLVEAGHAKNVNIFFGFAG